MRQVGKVRAEDVERLRHELESVPAPRTEELSKKQAIESLAPQLRDLLTKGHSFRSLAAVLSQRGLSINPMLLASYLRGVPTHGEVRAGKRARARKKAKRRAAAAKESTAASTMDGGSPDSLNPSATVADATSLPSVALEARSVAAAATSEGVTPTQHGGGRTRDEASGSVGPVSARRPVPSGEVERAPRVQPPLRGTFVPRKDTDDI
jgi:hypothetical protein